MNKITTEKNHKNSIKMTYYLHMNIQTFAYSTIISPKKIYEQKKS